MISALLLIPIAAAQVAAPRLGSGPHVVFSELPAMPAIVRFRAGPARCGGEEQRALIAEEPFPIGVMRAPPANAAVTIRFRIDADGRPLSISSGQPALPGYGIGDVPAALATWRFEPGAERRDCAIAFAAVTTPVASASPETLYRFLALHPISGQPRMNEVGRPAFEQATPAGSNCHAPRPNARLLAFPPFEEIAQPPGTVSYSFATHDIAADGRPRNVRIVGSSGNRELDRATIEAISRSRFQRGARTGCLHHFYRRQTEPMRPPQAPEEEAFRPAGATCPEDAPDWASMPPLEFPREFNRRHIEGWAIVSYDLAPWGETGNVAVLAAEPAAAFGEQAARIVRGARTASGGSGHTGCTARVIFRLPEAEGEPVAEE